jgi:dTMP kinase
MKKKPKVKKTSKDTLQNALAGKFIVIDGPDGCGKSTQARLLAGWLQKKGVVVECFRDPGGTDIGEKIREILLNPEHNAMGTRTELLLYMAARAQLWQEKISPALSAGECVILDRWLSSTAAYQGFAGSFGFDNMEKIAEGCLERTWPDLTIILDLDIQTAGSRLKDDRDRIEQKGNDYHNMVRKGFLKLASEKSGFAVVNAASDIDDVHKKITDIILKKF